MIRWPKTWVLFGVSIAVMAVTLALTYTSLPPQIPLLYSLPEASDHIVDTWVIGILPLIVVGFAVINKFIAHVYFENEPIVMHILRITNDVMIIAFTVIFVRILILVT